MEIYATKEELEYEVRYLEGVLGKFIINTDLNIKQINRLSAEMKVEMKEFKSEMMDYKVFTEKTIESLNREMKEFKDEMKEFKDEMKEFKIEMKQFKDESIADRREMNKKWGELANKLGTFAEDIAAPNIPRIAKESFGCDKILYHSVRIDARNPNVEYDMSEFDAITECHDKVFLLETKYTVRMQYIEKLPDLIDQFKYCFPQYKGKQLIPVFGSMYVPENIVKKLSKLGFYVMVMGDDNMDIINFESVKKSIYL